VLSMIKFAMVELSWQHWRRSLCHDEEKKKNRLSSEFDSSFYGGVPFLKYLNSLITQKAMCSPMMKIRTVVIENQLVTDTQAMCHMSCICILQYEKTKSSICLCVFYTTSTL